MKLTKSQLRRIIKEELSALLEATDPHDQPAGGDKPTTTELDKKKKECKDEGGTWREASESKGPKSKSYDLSRGLQGYCEKKKKK